MLAACFGPFAQRARSQIVPSGGAPALEIVGRLTGDDVAVNAAASIDVENGRSTALLASGSDVTVRSGQAKIDLEDGGDIAICGPAHFSVLKSNGAITLALDYGRVHPQLTSPLALIIYTPLIVVTPVAIGQSARDLTLGLDAKGEMCALTASGAVRVEQQLTGQSLLVPQGGEVHLSGGELSTMRQSSGGCACELMVSREASLKEVELSVPIHPPAAPPAKPETAPVPPPVETVYRVDMPPLTFDSKSPAPPPDPDPSTMVLVRETRAAPEVIFRGRVEAAAPPEPVQKPAAQPASAPPQKKASTFSRFFGLFHHRAAPCAGSGCGDAGQ